MMSATSQQTYNMTKKKQMRYRLLETHLSRKGIIPIAHVLIVEPPYDEGMKVDHITCKFVCGQAHENMKDIEPVWKDSDKDTIRTYTRRMIMGKRNVCKACTYRMIKYYE